MIICGVTRNIFRGCDFLSLVFSLSLFPLSYGLRLLLFVPPSYSQFLLSLLVSICPCTPSPTNLAPRTSHISLFLVTSRPLIVRVVSSRCPSLYFPLSMSRSFTFSLPVLHACLSVFLSCLALRVEARRGIIRFAPTNPFFSPCVHKHINSPSLPLSPFLSFP
ncbi:hypothetical protein FRC16_006698 [Serendipita sp. 398]|nr:hypothetical protein FRC16_006698 [Serendipita sp. 398]